MGGALSVATNNNHQSSQQIENLTEDDLCVHTCLHEYVSSGAIAAVRMALKEGADVNIQDQEGNTAIHMGAASGNLQILKVLVEEVVDEGEADVNICNRDGLSPFHISVMNDNTEIVKYMLDCGGADVLAKTAADGKTPLELAILYKNKDTAQIIRSYLEERLKDALESIEQKQQMMVFMSCMQSFYGAELVGRYQRDICELRSVLWDNQVQVEALASAKREQKMGSNIQVLDEQAILKQQQHRQNQILDDFLVVNARIQKQIQNLDQVQFVGGDEIKQQLIESESVNAGLQSENQQLQQTVQQLCEDMGRISDELCQLQISWLAMNVIFTGVQEAIEKLQQQVVMQTGYQQKVVFSNPEIVSDRSMDYCNHNGLGQFEGDGDHSCGSSATTEIIQQNLCVLSRQSSMEVANFSSFVPSNQVGKVCLVSICRNKDENWGSGQLTPKSPILLECDSDNSSATEVGDQVLEQNEQLFLSTIQDEGYRAKIGSRNLIQDEVEASGKISADDLATAQVLEQNGRCFLSTIWDERYHAKIESRNSQDEVETLEKSDDQMAEQNSADNLTTAQALEQNGQRFLPTIQHEGYQANIGSKNSQDEEVEASEKKSVEIQQESGNVDELSSDVKNKLGFEVVEEVLEQNLGGILQELERIKIELDILKQKYIDALQENQVLLDRVTELIQERERIQSQNDNLKGELQQMRVRVCEEGVLGIPSVYKEVSKQYNNRIKELNDQVRQLQMQGKPELKHVATNTEEQEQQQQAEEVVQIMEPQNHVQHQQEVFGLNQRIEELQSQCSCLQEEKQQVVEDFNSQIIQLKTQHYEEMEQINCQQTQQQQQCDQHQTCTNYRKLTAEYHKIFEVNKNIVDRLHATEKDVENLRIYNDSLVLRIKKGNNDLQKAEIEQRKLQRFCWKSGEALDIAQKEKEKLLYSLECLSKEKKFITEIPMYREVQCKNQRRENWLKQLVKKIG